MAPRAIAVVALWPHGTDVLALGSRGGQDGSGPRDPRARTAARPTINHQHPDGPAYQDIRVVITVAWCAKRKLSFDPREVRVARLFSPGDLPAGMPEAHRERGARADSGNALLAGIGVQAVEFIEEELAQRPRGEGALEEAGDPARAVPARADPHQ
jgi:hypothetical protein